MQDEDEADRLHSCSAHAVIVYKREIALRCVTSNWKAVTTNVMQCAACCTALRACTFTWHLM